MQVFSAFFFLFHLLQLLTATIPSDKAITVSPTSTHYYVVSNRGNNSNNYRSFVKVKDIREVYLDNVMIILLDKEPSNIIPRKLTTDCPVQLVPKPNKQSNAQHGHFTVDWSKCPKFHDKFVIFHLFYKRDRDFSTHQQQVYAKMWEQPIEEVPGHYRNVPHDVDDRVDFFQEGEHIHIDVTIAPPYFFKINMPDGHPPKWLKED